MEVLDGGRARRISAKTYIGTESWLTPESVARVARHACARPPTTRERRALEHLHAYLAGEWMAQQLADVSDAIATLEQSLTFKVAGTDRAYRNLESILATERSALRRRQIYEAATEAVEKVSALMVRRGARAAELLPALNLEPTAWTTELREARPEALEALADAVLTRTQDVWTATLTRLAQRELQLPLDRIGRQDVPRLVRLPATEGFKRVEVVPRIRSTLGPLQLDPAALKTVTLDAGDSPKKNPRGLVLGVVVPTDVRISLKPAGGARDQRSALHEFGHAVHDAFTEERRFELAKLGNRTNAEAFAALFESLTTEPAWLEQSGLSPDASRTWVQGVAVQELYLVRRAAGKVLFNVAASTPRARTCAPPTGRRWTAPSGCRARRRTRRGSPSTRRPRSERRTTSAAGSSGRSSVRRWCGSSAGAGGRSRAPGGFLKPLLAPGNALDADGMARALGDPGVSPDAFVAAVVPRLSGGGPEGQPTAPKQPAAPPGPPPGATPAAGPAGAGGTAAAATTPAAGQAAPDAGIPEAAGTK